MKRIFLVCFFMVSILSNEIFSGVNTYKIFDKKYLRSSMTILFSPVDTLKEFNGDKPQGYYLNLFLTAMTLGINGYTNYEVIEESKIVKHDLTFKFTILTLDYDGEEESDEEFVSYKTKFSVEINGLNPANNKKVFYVKKSCTSHIRNEEDELKDNILEATDNLIEFLSKQRKKRTLKSFYINKLVCSNLEDKKISYKILSDREDSFQEKLRDVIEAEMQQYFYENKIMILKLTKPNDSLLNEECKHINLDSYSNVFDSQLGNSLKKSSVDFLLIIDKLTSFKSEKLLEQIKYRFRFKSIGNMSVPADDPSADMEEMNAYDRIYCSLHLIDVKNNCQVFRTQFYLIEDRGCEDPEQCFPRRVLGELGEFDIRTNTISPCY